MMGSRHRERRARRHLGNESRSLQRALRVRPLGTEDHTQSRRVLRDGLGFRNDFGATRRSPANKVRPRPTKSLVATAPSLLQATGTDSSVNRDLPSNQSLARSPRPAGNRNAMDRGPAVGAAAFAQTVPCARPDRGGRGDPAGQHPVDRGPTVPSKSHNRLFMNILCGSIPWAPPKRRDRPERLQRT